jgi:uncharacterized protein (TIGR02646 family)
VIRIEKPSHLPAKLAQDGKRKRRSHCISYSKNPGGYQSGEKSFSFDAKIYAHATVKQALMEAQHRKCCFCERIIGTDGDVEHFRPKQAYRQKQGQPLQRPGYYWLAYEWDNLYLACTGCNQRHKQNLFPLQHLTKRAIDHHHDIEDEQPLLIDPGKDEPEALIGFRGEFAYSREGNARATATVESLQLNGRSLPEIRLKKLQELKLLWQLAEEISPARPQDAELRVWANRAKVKIEQAMKGDAEFAALVRCAVETKFEFVMG